MKKYILLSMALFSFANIQSTFADYNFKDWEKVEVSWYYFSSTLTGDCGWWAWFGPSQAWESQKKYSDYLPLISKIGCWPKWLWILSDIKEVPVDLFEYKSKHNIDSVDWITKTEPTDFLLLAGKNLKKNLLQDPVFIDWMKTDNMQNDMKIQGLLDIHLDTHDKSTYFKNGKQFTDINRNLTENYRILVKGVYLNPKWLFPYISPFDFEQKSVNIQMDLKIIIVDDIEIIKTEKVKYKYLNDKIIAVLDKKINNLILNNVDVNNIDKSQKAILNSLIKSVDKIILKSTWKKKEAYMEVNLFLKEKLDKLNKPDEINLEFLFQN